MSDIGCSMISIEEDEDDESYTRDGGCAYTSNPGECDTDLRSQGGGSSNLGSGALGITAREERQETVRYRRTLGGSA